MNITLAIPSYNGSGNLHRLVSRLLEEDFTAIYVLDDASTDNSLEILAEFGDNIHVIKGDKNLGAGGNRNRIIDYVQDGIIMFLDADMVLETRGVRQKIETLFEDKTIGLVGGQILNKTGEPMGWNFGQEMHPVSDAILPALFELASKHSDDKELLADINKLADRYSPSWGDLRGGPTERVVDWVAEGSFCVRADLFARIGGYDPVMRYHETHDLGKRIRNAGYTIKFSPSIIATHLAINVRGETRTKDFRDAQLYFYQKHWGMSEKVFNKLQGSDTD